MSHWKQWMQEAEQQEEDRLEAEALAREQFDDRADRRWLRHLRDQQEREKREREEAKKREAHQQWLKKRLEGGLKRRKGWNEKSENVNKGPTRN